MQNPFDILPQKILMQLMEFYSREKIEQAFMLMRHQEIQISFLKENPGKYFIVSGIMHDKKMLETRVTFRGHEVTSHCNCEEKLTSNCIHSLVLLLKYFMDKVVEGKIEERVSDFKNDRADGIEIEANLDTNYVVSCREFGIVIASPNKFENAFGAESYSKLRYRLQSGKIVGFSLPKAFKGNLLFILIPTDDGLLLRFQYESEEGEAIREISILEGLYLYNWNNGEVFHLPPNLGQIIRKLAVYEGRLSGDADEYLRLLAGLVSDQTRAKVWIYDEDKKIRLGDFSSESMRRVLQLQEIKVVINQSNRKSHYDINLNFPYIPSSFFKLFCFQQGYLDQFEKKYLGIDFAVQMMGWLEGRKDEWRMVRGGPEKTFISDWMDILTSSEHLYTYDREQKIIVAYSIKVLIEMMRTIYSFFGSHIFRFASFDKNEKKVVFTLPSQMVMEKLSDFYYNMAEKGIEVYFENKVLRRWKGNIRLQRNQSVVGWFDFSMQLSEEDLNIIKNIDLKTKVWKKTGKSDPEEKDKNKNADELILIDDSQKEIILMIQEHIRHSGSQGKSSKIVTGTSGGIEADSNSHIFHIMLSRGRIFEVFEFYKRGWIDDLTEDEKIICDNLMNLKELPTYEMAPLKTGTPRSYQHTGACWLRFLFESRLGACLADDMGLGKTLQTIMFLQTVIHRCQRILILCPVSLILNWKNEFEKFSDLTVGIYYGENRLFGDEKIIITSYGIIRKEIDAPHIKNLVFDILIMDEIQNLKNIKSQGAISARKIKAGFRIGLTGTPVENDISEFYNIIDLCIPGIWKDKKKMESERLEHQNQSNAEMKINNINNMSMGSSLHTSIHVPRVMAKKVSRPFILRRTKDQVLADLPEKIENTVFLNFSEDERLMYQAELIKIRENLKNTTQKVRYGEVLKGILKLRQMCLWYASGMNSKVDNKNNDELSFSTSTKIQFLMDTLTQVLEEGHSVLVISQFTSYLDIIEGIIKSKFSTLAYSRIDGKQNMKKRQSEVDLFQNGKTKLFLISLKAGGVGLNLTKASYIFLMDPWWNPAVENQAIDRAYRIGQMNKVTVYRPIIKDSVEEKVLKLQEHKKELFHDLLDTEGDEFFSGRLTMEDFEEILR